MRTTGLSPCHVLWKGGQQGRVFSSAYPSCSRIRENLLTLTSHVSRDPSSDVEPFIVEAMADLKGTISSLAYNRWIIWLLSCLNFLENNSGCLQAKPHKSYLHILKAIQIWSHDGEGVLIIIIWGKQMCCSTSLTNQKDVRRMTKSSGVNSELHTRINKAHAISIFWDTVLFIPRVTTLCVHSFYRRQETGMARANLIF